MYFCSVVSYIMDFCFVLMPSSVFKVGKYNFSWVLDIQSNKSSPLVDFNVMLYCCKCLECCLLLHQPYNQSINIPIKSICLSVLYYMTLKFFVKVFMLKYLHICANDKYFNDEQFSPNFDYILRYMYTVYS